MKNIELKLLLGGGNRLRFVALNPKSISNGLEVNVRLGWCSYE